MTAGRPPIGDRAMTNAEHQRRWYDKHRRKQPSAPPTPPPPAFKPKRKEKEGGRLCVDKHDRILVDLPAKGERIYVDERGREIAEPPITAGRVYIDDRGRIVEELPRTMTDEELARLRAYDPLRNLTKRNGATSRLDRQRSLTTRPMPSFCAKAAFRHGPSL
jgi:hypothetical protein